MNRQETFESAVKKRLSRYKQEHLGVEEDGFWDGRPYSHILPDEMCELNLLETIRTPFLSYDTSARTKRHKGFPNLNSSQVMALNFWFPFCPEGEALLNWKCSGHLNQMLELDSIAIESAKFEAELNLNERTQIDWWCKTPSGDQIFCEVKYTEPLGSASGKGTDYRVQWERVYRDELAHLVDHDALNDLGYFQKNYQVFRNIWHLRLGNGVNKNKLVFLLPEKSPSFSKLTQSLAKIAPQGTLAHERISILSLEKAALLLMRKSSSLGESRHWRLFATKYCPWVLEKENS